MDITREVISEFAYYVRFQILSQNLTFQTIEAKKLELPIYTAKNYLTKAYGKIVSPRLPIYYVHCSMFATINKFSEKVEIRLYKGLKTRKLKIVQHFC